MNKKFDYKKLIYLLAFLCCFLPFIDTPLALLIGIIVAQTVGNPFSKITAPTQKYLLQASVVGLGFGIKASDAIQAGKEGFIFTVISITFVLTIGYFLGKKLLVGKNISYLISVGTAICGGSAIAAVAPLIKSNKNDISIAIGVIFILNSVALFLFPFIGHLLNLSQQDFGMWAAIAIHDTSSVVGAAQTYGSQALQIATTVKLQRALWIVPVTLLTSFLFKSESKKVSIPIFILLFITALFVRTLFPEPQNVYDVIVLLAKRGMIISIFLIGTGLTRHVLKSVGPRALLQGVILWFLISVISLVVIIFT